MPYITITVKTDDHTFTETLAEQFRETLTQVAKIRSNLVSFEVNESSGDPAYLNQFIQNYGSARRELTE